MIKKTFRQFFKFLITGTNNTGLDFLILNILMKVSNVYSGPLLILFNCLSFSLAVTNSYLINRYWTFEKNENKKIRNIQILLIFILLLILVNLKFLRINFLSIVLIVFFLALVVFINSYIIRNFASKEKITANSLKFGKFVFLTLLGMAINSGIFYFLTTHFQPLFGLSRVLWANFSKAIATIISLFWNFFSYKFIIFRK